MVSDQMPQVAFLGAHWLCSPSYSLTLTVALRIPQGTPKQRKAWVGGTAGGGQNAFMVL